MTARRTHDTLLEALLAVQRSLPEVRKNAQGQDADGTVFSYADLAEVTDALIPALARHGLVWTTEPTMRRGQFVLRYELIHVASDTKRRGHYPLPDPRSSSTVFGGAISIARRQALLAVTGVAPRGDDDTPPPAPSGPASEGVVRDSEPWQALINLANTQTDLDAIKERMQAAGEETDKLKAAWLARAGFLARAEKAEAKLATLAEAGAALLEAGKTSMGKVSLDEPPGEAEHT